MFVVGIRKRVVISQNQEFFPFPHKLAMLIQIEHLNLQEKHLWCVLNIFEIMNIVTENNPA